MAALKSKGGSSSRCASGFDPAYVLLGGADWRQELTRREDDEVIARFRKWTNRGSPLGSDRFVAKLESLLGRRLRPLPVGRPRKKTTKPKKPKANSRQ